MMDNQDNMARNSKVCKANQTMKSIDDVQFWALLSYTKYALYGQAE